MITTQFYSVNTKKYAVDIANFVEGCLDGPAVLITDKSHRKAITDLTFDLLEELQTIGIIDNFKIIGDSRNNTAIDLRVGRFTIEIQYKEHNCFNLTRIKIVCLADITR